MTYVADAPKPDVQTATQSPQPDTGTPNVALATLGPGTGSASDPICGNCGNPLSKHFHEREEYCNDTTTGDVFTDEPSSALLADWLMGRHPGLHARLVNQWKCEHGHKPNIKVRDAR